MPDIPGIISVVTAGIILVVGIISVVIGRHFGGGDHFDGGDHFGGGTRPKPHFALILVKGQRSRGGLGNRFDRSAVAL